MAIDEKKLIEDLKNTFSDSVLNQTFGFGKYTLLEAVEEMINRQPQVETDTNVGSKWIPCEERLPENDEDVLVQMQDDSMMVDFRTASSSGWFWADNDDLPVAWQPLPQTFKKEGNSNAG